MNIYIQGVGQVSAWQTSGSEPKTKDNHYTVIDPDYSQWIEPNQIRRMSRVIKMGVAAAHRSMAAAEIELPDAIITGTAYGCLADTGVFLQKLVTQQEEFLTPTSFIQSTHNTLGGQLALKMGCQGYNNTFVQGSFSFEHSLLDAGFFLQENQGACVLVGSADEITPYSHAILSRFGKYKKSLVAADKLLSDPSKGSLAGEGSAFFVVQSSQNEKSVARVVGLEMNFKKMSVSQMKDNIVKFLHTYKVDIQDISLLMSGRNGDSREDYQYEEAENTIFSNTPKAAFKHLCGEYPTAISFGLAMAATLIHSNSIPSEMMNSGELPKEINSILIWNAHSEGRHSLILLEKC